MALASTPPYRTPLPTFYPPIACPFPFQLPRAQQHPLFENRHMPLPDPLHQRLPLHALMMALRDGGERGRGAREVFEGAEAGVGVAG